ncbi:MAG: BatA and WFA domain-containing protein [Armatimonadota bacterium]|nr:BatA and WFA domain-containing protein [Armatimonadota bacterium]MDR7439564.1 BatA and WFA domain-containing protein [Armatimonadota bacterium]MDR7568023.1 BatA and WFA domain-containing protein [Armatimonadota bacterium]MDR7601056.1 BatA and WFA domain-containing protein [Armatimonadota bacterium]
MTLENPSALWWLVSIPFLVLLYFLRTRRLEVVVPSLLLWQRAARELLVRRPVRRLERNLLLLVQILAVCAASFALARPHLLLPGGVGADVAVVVDLSLSMQARDLAPNRFEVARRAAQELLARVGPGHSAALVGAARTPRLIRPLSPPAEALEALRELEPTDGNADLEGAVRLARALARPGRSLEVHVFSDRSVPGTVAHLFGRTARNVGLVALLAYPQASGRLRVVLRIRNDAPTPSHLPVVVRVDGREAVRAQVSLPALGERGMRFDVPQGEVVEGSLLVQDDLPADDRQVTLGRRPLPTVLVVGRSTAFLFEALRAIGVLEVARSESPDPRQWPPSDVVIVDRVPVQELPPGNALLIRTVPHNLPVRVTGTVPAPRVVHLRRTHPLLRFVELSELRLRDALILETRAGEVLVEGDSPLVWGYEAGTHRVVLLAFDLEGSDFGLQPAFPIFLSNTLDWLAGAGRFVVQAGEELTLPAGTQREAWLEGPLGSVRLAATAGVFRTPPLDRAGIYRLRTAYGVVRTIAVQPAARERPLVVPGAAPLAAQAGEARTAGRDLSRGFLWLFLALLVGEWGLFLRQRGRGPAASGRQG